MGHREKDEREKDRAGEEIKESGKYYKEIKVVFLMVAAVMVVEIRIPGSGSLKDKRQVIRSLKAVLRNKFNVSVAETGHQDLLQRAELGVAAVGSDRVFLEREMENVYRFIESRAGAEIIGRTIDYF